MAEQRAGSVGRPQRRGNELTSSTKDLVDGGQVVTLEQYYAIVKGNEEKLAKYKKSLDSDRISKEIDAKTSSLKDLYALELALSQQGIELTEEMREQYLRLHADDQKKLNQELIKQYFAEYDKQSRLSKEKEAKIDAKRLEINKKREEAERKKAEGDTKGAKKATREADRAEALLEITEQWTEKFKEFIDQVNAGVGVWNKAMSDLGEHSVKQFGKNITSALEQVNSAISSYANYQAAINTRLQGANATFSSLTKTLSDVAYSPLLSSEDLYSNLNELIGQGIVTNVGQRAFFETVKESIASTFDANTATLNRLIRLQQIDSTASRLGMEGFMTRFLNEFVDSTEYLTNSFDAVADKLFEASALMSASQATEFEFVVQKWLGTLTGVGLSETATQAIATAIGQLGSGDISNLASSPMQNMLVMAASNVGLDYSQLLSQGLTAETTNQLMYGLTNYLQELGTSTSNVVRSELARTFGVSVSDIVASRNLDSEELNKVYRSMMTTNDMYAELTSQFNQMSERLGTSKMIENAIKNFTYQTGMRMGGSTGMQTTWAITNLIEGVTGGTNIPFISALGTGIDLEATLEQLVKIGLMGGMMATAIPDVIRGIAGAGKGSTLLDAMGVSADNVSVRRGQGLDDYARDDLTSPLLRQRRSSLTVSESEVISETGFEDIRESGLVGAYDEANTALDKNLSEQQKEDEVVTYLKEMEFQAIMESIEKNVESIAKDGIPMRSVYMPSMPTVDGFNAGEEL